jgi:hypothetical protein
MKAHHTHPGLLTIASAVVYTFFFWNESMGINLVLFSATLIALMLFRSDKAYRHKSVQWSIAALLFTGAMVVLWNSTTAVVAHIASFYVLTGTIYAPQLRSLQNVLALVLINQAKAPANLVRSFVRTESQVAKRSFRPWYWMRVVILPLVLLLIFFIIYFNANTKFELLTNNFFDHLFQSLEWFFSAFSFPMLGLFITGLILCAGVLIVAKNNKASEWDANAKTEIGRERTTNKKKRILLIALKTEYRMALILLVMMNLLLIVVNYTDIRYVWVEFEWEGVGSLSKFVHEGTYLLILSILLSKAIVLYYFRRNLNFYQNSRTIQVLAIAWMCQNVVLALSVAMRNWYYVQYYALAYKRIGVFIFLILVMFGLITMMIKIRRRHTGYQLLRLNALAAFVMLIAMSAINWDPWIIRYNLYAKHEAGFDASFCFVVSEKSYPIILENMDRITYEMANGKGLMKYSRDCADILCFMDNLQYKVDKFIDVYERESILSWNYADYTTYNYLKTKFGGREQLPTNE